MTLYAKNSKGERQPYLPSRRWIDGSVTNDLPVKRLGRLYGVNHFIVSQTNPLALPFVFDPKVNNGMLSLIRGAAQKNIKDWFNVIARIGRDSTEKYPAARNLFGYLNGVLEQDYTADINIFPPTRLFAPHKLLAHRSDDEIFDLLTIGEKSTWPKIDMIRTQTKISRTLDRILKRHGNSSFT